jgi:hypothetical protein
MMMRAAAAIGLMLALQGCSRNEFLGRVEAIQDGSRNSYFAAKAQREDKAAASLPADMGTIRRPPPEPKPDAEKAKTAEPPAPPPPRQYIYIVPVH